MELIRWANDKGYTLMADSEDEFDLLRKTLNENPPFDDKVEVDESSLFEEVK